MDVKKEESLWNKVMRGMNEAVASVDPREKIRLRRSFGDTFTEADPDAKVIFYSHIPENIIFYEDEFGDTQRDIWFFGMCLWAFQDGMGEQKFQEILSIYYNDKDTSEAQKAKLRALLTYRMDDTGRVIHYLVKMIKMFYHSNKKKYQIYLNRKISVISLMTDLMYWNEENRSPAIFRWANTIARARKEEGREEND